MATYSCHWLIMGKVKIGIYCYLTADILTKFSQKCSVSFPLPNTPFCCSLLICLVTMEPNGENSWILKNELLRSCLGDTADTLCRNGSNISLYKIIVFIVVAQALWLLWQLKVSIDLQWEKWKLRFIAISLQIFWQKIYRNVCSVILH